MNFALITGATKGIGYELMLLFAQKGYHLILVARHKDRLIEISKEIEQRYGIKVHTIPIDLSTLNSAETIYRFVQEKGVSVQYLVNNAGFYVKGAFSETLWDDEAKLIQQQCLTYTSLVKLFLPGMLKQQKGGILNVGSTGSFVPGPFNAVYCASKSFVLSFTEALAEELTGTGVTATALCPGGTRTTFQEYDKKNKSIIFRVMEAGDVARVGFKALMKGKRVAIPGWFNQLEVFFVRFIPRRLVAKLAHSIVAHQG